MKIKPYTKILAGAYVLCGLLFFFITLHFRSLYSEEDVQVAFITKAVLAVGPLGWLLVTLVLAALVVLKDFRFRSRFMNSILTVFLALLVGGIAFATVVVWVISRYDSMSA